ncbi:hypothetical protein BDQ17DRAFT_1328393 [Cyathus striatus]|nr:hypothetical protein BDQ17DRAFT_1328393 [Cyathus striatus]
MLLSPWNWRTWCEMEGVGVGGWSCNILSLAPTSLNTLTLCDLQLRKRVKDIEKLEEDENITFNATKWRKLGGFIWWAEEVWGVRLTRLMHSLRRRYPSGQDEEASNLVVEAKSLEPQWHERYADVQDMYDGGMGVMGSMGPLDLMELFGHFRSHGVRVVTIPKKFNVTKALIPPV